MEQVLAQDAATVDPLEPRKLQWSDSLIQNPHSLVEQVQRQGYAVVRSVFPPEEIERMRGVVKGHLSRAGSRFSLGKTQPNAAIVVPQLGWVMSHPRVVSLFKALIGADRAVFTGHCDIHMNMLSGWHRDSGEAFGSYFSEGYMTDQACRVFKMAIYLQDTGDRDGLTVVPHAHVQTKYDTKDSVHLRTRVGDVVIFDVRLPHTGQLPNWIEKGIKAVNVAVKGRDRTIEDARIATNLKRAYCAAIGRRDRLSIFFTYGEDNRRTHEFAIANMSRQNKQANLEETRLPGKLVADLSAQGVKVSAT